MTGFWRRKLTWIVLAALLLFGAAIFFGSNISAPFVYRISNGGSWLLPLLLVAAIADSINPCAFSILIITIAFLMNMGKMRSDILRIGGSYIFGIFVIYLLIGLGILQALHLFNTPHFMAKVGAGLLIVLGGINLINEFFPSFPIKLRIPQAAHGAMASVMRKGSMPAAFLLGALVGLCEFPCTGGPYLAILGLIHDSAMYLRGIFYLILYNVVFIAPLLVILFLAGNRELLTKVETLKKEHTRDMRLYGSIVMMLLGVIMFLI